MDTLTIKGLSRRLDGDYKCDIAGMVDISSEEALTVREANFIRDFSGARGGEIVEAFLKGDVAVRSALARVVLGRHDIPIREETLLDLKSGWCRFELGADEAEEDAEEATEAERPPTAEGETPSTTGGTSGRTPSDPQDGSPSPTAPQGSLRSVDSSPETLAS